MFHAIIMCINMHFSDCTCYECDPWPNITTTRNKHPYTENCHVLQQVWNPRSAQTFLSYAFQCIPTSPISSISLVLSAAGPKWTRGITHVWTTSDSWHAALAQLGGRISIMCREFKVSECGGCSESAMLQIHISKVLGKYMDIIKFVTIK